MRDDCATAFGVRVGPPEQHPVLGGDSQKRLSRREFALFLAMSPLKLVELWRAN